MDHQQHSIRVVSNKDDTVAIFVAEIHGATPVQEIKKDLNFYVVEVLQKDHHHRTTSKLLGTLILRST